MDLTGKKEEPQDVQSCRQALTGTEILRKGDFGVQGDSYQSKRVAPRPGHEVQGDRHCGRGRPGTQHFPGLLHFSADTLGLLSGEPDFIPHCTATLFTVWETLTHA